LKRFCATISYARSVFRHACSAEIKLGNPLKAQTTFIYVGFVLDGVKFDSRHLLQEQIDGENQTQ
jgi:hypothetical protein